MPHPLADNPEIHTGVLLTDDSLDDSYIKAEVIGSYLVILLSESVYEKDVLLLVDWWKGEIIKVSLPISEVTPDPIPHLNVLCHREKSGLPGRTVPLLSSPMISFYFQTCRPANLKLSSFRTTPSRATQTGKHSDALHTYMYQERSERAYSVARTDLAASQRQIQPVQDNLLNRMLLHLIFPLRPIQIKP